MRSLVLTASLLFACGPTSAPSRPDIAAPHTQGDISAPQPPSVCALPAGTIDKNTPDKGYWVSDGCAVGCLPPRQFFSICTTNAGVLLFDGTTELQQYGATWEAYLPRNPCPSAPWRVWQLELVPTPDLPGAWADPSIESDCTPYPKKNNIPLPTGRFYYRATGEFKKAVQQ